MLRNSVKEKPEGKGPVWRVDQRNFIFPKHAKYMSGSVDFSASWFQANHDVRYFKYNFDMKFDLSTLRD
jgi:hypothetical protein